MSEQKKGKSALKVGTKASITIEENPEGLQVALELHGEKLDLNAPTAVQTLALVGCEAVRAAIRQTFKVESEAMVSGPRNLEMKSKTH